MEKDALHSPITPVAPEELIARIEVEQDRLEKIKSDLARVALHDTTQAEDLQGAVDKLVQSANGMREVTLGREAVNNKAFGSEPSYWTVYRMFCAVNNLGRQWDLDEIWHHLAKNYDMSKETYASLEETLDEWSADIEEDVAADKGIIGWFIQHEGKYVFAERQSDVAPAMKQKPAQKAKAPLTPLSPVVRPEVTVKEEVEVPSALQVLGERITALLAALPDGVAKQADVKKQLTTTTDEAALEHIQHEINELVQQETLYKFRRGKLAYLSLTPHDDEVLPRKEVTVETEREAEEVDVPLSLDILKALCAPGTHHQRKITLRELWRNIHAMDDKSHAIPDSEIEQLKQACRQLRTTGLITASGEKMGTGGVKTNTGVSSKRRRSGSMQVYKVGLTSQQVKKELQKVLETPQADEYLQQKFSQNQ